MTVVHRLLRLLAAVIPAALAVVALPAAARAAETSAPPSHLAAYGMAWLNYLDPADVPAKRAAVCLVDSGVRVTPDTPATSPGGPIIARLAVDGGAGTPEGDSAAHLHGTRMAMAIGAPANGWGTIGAWSGAKIVSVRGTTAGESDFRGEYYQQGIKECLRYQADTGTRIAAINLSLGCGDCSLSAEQQAVLEDRVVRAHGFGATVVAAAGNSGAMVQVPASVTGVFAVAAGNHAGVLCPYGSSGPQVAVLGPACPVESADVLTGQPVLTSSGGSSVAAAVSSSLLAVLRTLRPDATWEQAEGWVRSSARTVDGRRVLNGKAAAVAAGLGPVVARAEARQAAAVTSRPSVASPSVDSGRSPLWAGGKVSIDVKKTRKLPRPKIALARRKGHRLTVVVRNRPKRAQVMLTLERLARDGLRLRMRKRVTRGASRLRTSSRWRPGRLRVRFLPAAIGKDDRRMSGERVLNRHGRRYR